MPTTPIYDDILAELAGGELPELEKSVLDLLKSSADGMTREMLCAEILGEFTPTNDRKVRKAIESLRDNGIAIESNSGRAGYRLSVNEDDLKKMAAEFESRAERNREKATAVQRIILKLQGRAAGPIRTELPLEQPKQLELV